MLKTCCARAATWLALIAVLFSAPGSVSLSGAAVAATAEPPLTGDSRFVIHTWGTDEGLPQGSVISILQSQSGYLWLGTLNGLVRFDGVRFTVFDEANTPGLISRRIVHLFEDSRTNLWVGTESDGVWSGWSDGTGGWPEVVGPRR
jgi:ligand-binding sensor domain-containing protein